MTRSLHSSLRSRLLIRLAGKRTVVLNAQIQGTLHVVGTGGALIRGNRFASVV